MSAGRDERGRFAKGWHPTVADRFTTREQMLRRAEEWLQRAQRHVGDNKRFQTCMREYATLMDRASRAKR